MRHSERLKDILPHKVVVALSRDLLHDIRQEKIVGIGIRVLRIRLKFERLRKNPVLNRGDGLVLGIPERKAVALSLVHHIGNARAHGEQVLDGDILSRFILGEILLYRIVYAQFALIAQHHHRGCAELFGNRADIH